MTCSEETRAQIALLDGGDLSPVQKWKLRRHCHTCAACRAEQARMRQLEAEMQNLARAHTPPHIYTALMAQMPELRSVDVPTSSHEDVVLDRDGNVRQRQSRRRWAVVAGAALVITVGGARVVPRLQEALFIYLTHGVRINHSVDVVYRDSAPLYPDNNTKFLDRTLELRLLWKPWAMQHKSQLRQMLIADNYWGDLPIKTVWDALPTTPPKDGSGITLKALNAGDFMFTWEPLAKWKSKRAPAVANTFHAGTSVQRDIALAHSLERGFTKYWLWASGRITEDSTVRQRKPSGHGTMYVSRTREVAPPYAELTQKH